MVGLILATLLRLAHQELPIKDLQEEMVQIAEEAPHIGVAEAAVERALRDLMVIQQLPQQRLPEEMAEVEFLQ